MRSVNGRRIAPQLEGRRLFTPEFKAEQKRQSKSSRNKSKKTFGLEKIFGTSFPKWWRRFAR